MYPSNLSSPEIIQFHASLVLAWLLESNDLKFLSPRFEYHSERGTGKELSPERFYISLLFCYLPSCVTYTVSSWGMSDPTVVVVVSLFCFVAFFFFNQEQKLLQNLF